MMEPAPKTYEALAAELAAMRWQLEEANDTIQAIRTGQIDALIVSGSEGPQLYALKTADQTYRMFVEQMNEGAVTLNTDGLILYCNSAFAQMLGQPVGNVLGALFSDFVPGESRPGFEALFARGWAGDAKDELSITGAGGDLPCQLSVSALRVDEEDSLSVIVTDLSFQKKTEAELLANNSRLEATNAALEQSNYDLLQFASVASHDLQEPLRKIMVFSGMLAKKLPAEEEEGAAMILDKISSSSQRMKTMIADILAYSRLTSEGPEVAPVPLQEVLSEIVDDYEVLIRDKGAVIDIDPLPVVMSARGQMRQVFQNLISNGLKFSSPGRPPHIRISCAQEAGEATCTITIADNGIGFDPQYSDRIFTLFQRLNTKDQYEGSGIGLAIARKIIDKHGGRISVRTVEGEGSEFKIVLPIVP